MGMLGIRLTLDTGADTLVDTEHREDIDINKLVKNSMASGLQIPTPVYMDTTDLPHSRGEAVARLTQVYDQLTAENPGITLGEIFNALNQAPAKPQSAKAPETPPNPTQTPPKAPQPEKPV